MAEGQRGGMIAVPATSEKPPVGSRPISDFQATECGSSTSSGSNRALSSSKVAGAI